MTDTATIEQQPLFTGIRMETNAAYHSQKLYVNASSLKNMDTSPMYYKFMLTQEVEKTDPMLLGSMVHCLMLESRAEFDKNFAVVEKIDKRSTEGKTRWRIFQLQNKGKDLVTNELYATAQAMYEAAMKKDTVRKLIADGEKEQSYYWYDEIRKIYCRIKPDFVGRKPERRYIADIKTANDVTPEGFAKVCASMKYDVQTGFYPMGLKAATRIDYPEFLFIAIENTPPYDVAVYDCDPDTMRFAKEHTNYLLDKLALCRARDEWKGVEEAAPNEYGIMGLLLPAWYRMRIEAQMNSFNFNKEA